MKETMLWLTVGLGLAMTCAIAGLAHLSATMFTLTVFCLASALIGPAIEIVSRLGLRAARAFRIRMVEG
jgi:hypothetical protein